MAVSICSHPCSGTAAQDLKTDIYSTSPSKSAHSRPRNPTTFAHVAHGKHTIGGCRSARRNRTSAPSIQRAKVLKPSLDTRAFTFLPVVRPEPQVQMQVSGEGATGGTGPRYPLCMDAEITV